MRAPRNPNGETLTATGQARYNSGTMSTTLLAPKPETIGRKIAEKRRELACRRVIWPAKSA